jgi:hypothetical protein
MRACQANFLRFTETVLRSTLVPLSVIAYEPLANACLAITKWSQTLKTRGTPCSATHKGNVAPASGG